MMNIRTVPQALKLLWGKKFFDGQERKFGEIKKEIGAVARLNPTDENLCMALNNAKGKFLTRRGRKGDYSYIQRYASKGVTLNEDVFPERLIKNMGDDFKTEIADLSLNYGRSGTCTAFLLRKLLEKMIFLAFAKNGISNTLKDSKKGDFVGLKTMLHLAITNKVQDKPFLMPKTAKELDGIKFLGDTAAHNPLTNVDMKTIIPQMPFIITAYEELSKNFKLKELKN